ncbi:MAG TPA: hypothetical protein VN808_16455 [Stellaceae bacterium]|nr:hypothetical protein [Stellaceae bacterium]
MALAYEEAAHDADIIDAQIIGAKIVDPTIVDGRIIDGRIIDGALIRKPRPGPNTERTHRFDRERAHGEIVVAIAFVLALVLVCIIKL